LHKNQRNQIYRGQCYTLKRTNRTYKYWMCAETFCHQQQLNELRRLAAEELRSSASSSLDTAAYFPTAVESKTIPQIYDEEAAAASTEPSTCGQFPIFKEVRSVMYKQRAKRFPKFPRDRWDLVFAPAFTITTSGMAFLFPQSASKHILVFSTANSIRLQAATKTWGMDGTFKVVPQWYQQLFTIHAFAAGKLVPAVYGLCTSKDIDTCGFLFQALITRAAALEVDLKPDTIICDLQAVHRKVGELGLKTRYRSDERSRRNIKMLLVTTFFPVPQVDMGVTLRNGCYRKKARRDGNAN
ncbi:hypothetical protein T10_10254, partial [Trichinella papuae]